MAAQGAEDRRRRPLHHDLAASRQTCSPTTSSGSPARARMRSCSRTRAGNPLIALELPDPPLPQAPSAAPACRCRFHDLRHTSVALAIADGAHPKAIQARMGHCSITVTLDRYGHLFPELDEAIAAAFGERLAAAHRPDRNEV